MRRKYKVRILKEFKQETHECIASYEKRIKEVRAYLDSGAAATKDFDCGDAEYWFCTGLDELYTSLESHCIDLEMLRAGRYEPVFERGAVWFIEHPEVIRRT